MEDQLDSFLRRIPDIKDLSAANVIGYFVYFLTELQGKTVATPAEVGECFRLADMAPYSNISQYLSRNASNKGGRRSLFVRRHQGYRLERTRKEELDKILGRKAVVKETSQTLRKLIPLVTGDSERSFLKEAIDCYEIKAYRAAIVMAWILSLDHLFEFIFTHKLDAFNNALSKIKDKRLKIKAISSKDDFSDIPEARFIEIARSAKIISNDVRKILVAKLGIRNSCAHPSGVRVPQLKAAEFIQDLVDNVVTKYQI